jgi:site-specific recombinase XerD
MRNPIGRASTVQCNQLTNAKIEQVIQETAVALKEVRQYVEFLAQGRVFPHDPLARNQMIESHHKIIANLEKDIEDLLDARASRPARQS